MNEALGRGLGAVLRRRAVGDPLIVHVEDDTAVIWAGSPPWIGARFLVPTDADLTDPPPAACIEWHSWARARGGVDQDLTQLRITLTARKDLLVVVDGLKVTVHARKPVPPWRTLECGAGGADIAPRRAEIQLTGFDPPTVSWLDDDGEYVDAVSFSVGAGEVEMLHLWAYPGDDEWVEWTAVLFALVDGKRKEIPIGDPAKPFVTTGGSGSVSYHVRAGGSDAEWSPPI